MPEVKTPDAINPAHYRQGPACPHCGNVVECITVTRHMSFSVGNAIKYLWRYRHKGTPVTDLKKAQWYLDDEIKRIEGESEYVATN